MTDRPEESPGAFQPHLREAAAGILERFFEAARPEIYAFSFNIWRIEIKRLGL